MTWDPKDGPSREALVELVRDHERFRASYTTTAPGVIPTGWDIDGEHRAALAAHDLYEENQRLKTEVALGVELLRQSQSIAAEAKRDTERLDWLDTTGVTANTAMVEGCRCGTCQGWTIGGVFTEANIRKAIDNAMKAEPVYVPSERQS